MAWRRTSPLLRPLAAVTLGGVFSKIDFKGSWSKDDVKKWQEECDVAQKQYYNFYKGGQFYEIDCSEEDNMDLLKAKVCFALFGLPTVGDVESMLDGYTFEQQIDASKFVETICSQYKHNTDATVEVVVLYIFCKEGDREYTLPIFGIRFEDGTIKYVDAFKRVYENWNDWEKNNRNPKMKYCYPKHGFYSCAEDNENPVYKEEKFPVLAYGTSPACDFRLRAYETMDIVAKVATAGIFVAGMITPLAPLVTVSAGTTFSAWAAFRATERLIDKGKHGESLADLESSLNWLKIGLTPLSLASDVVNTSLVREAQAGQSFTSTARISATLLNCSKLGIKGAQITLGIADLTQKAVNKKLTPLDVAQFSMACLYFANTVMKPVTANAIIQRTQTIQMQSSQSDENVQNAFARLLAENNGNGGPAETVRQLTRIEDPDDFFINNNNQG